MKERKITFTAGRVRDIRNGLKLATRRVISPDPWEVIPPKAGEPPWPYGFKVTGNNPNYGEPFKMACPYGVVGDRLWVQEDYQITSHSWRFVSGIYLADKAPFCVELTEKEFAKFKARKFPNRVTPGRFMYRSLARLVLELEDVSAQRILDMDPHDDELEGITCENVIIDVRCYGGSSVEITGDRYFYDGCGNDDGWEDSSDAFHHLWDSIHGEGAFERNPWVWALLFKVLDPGS